jgi:hypothetical protein
LCFAFNAASRAIVVFGSSPSFIAPESGVGHAEDEQPLSAVRRADFLRAKESFRNAETKSL